jgi:DNA polymerase (family 10)
VIGITDHSGGLGITQGLTKEKIRDQRREIDRVQKLMDDTIQILQGAEVEIKADGGLDFSDEILKEFDLVIASLHVSLRQPREKVTERMINAIHNPHVDIIGHPTGRIIPDREGADLDMDAVLREAKESGVALEINAHPARLDLEDIYARRACELGIPLSINTDAHSSADMDMLDFGIATARRGWVGPEDVINAWEPEKLFQWLKSRG